MQTRVRSRPTPRAGLAGTGDNPHDLTLIIGKSQTPPTSHRRVAVAANAGHAPVESHAGRVGAPPLAAGAVVRRRRLQ